MKKHALWLTIAAPILAGILISIHVSIVLFSGNGKKETLFAIKAGETFPRINSRLYEEEIISNPRVFHYYTRFKGLMTSFKEGTFKIPANADMPTVLKTLVYGKPMLEIVTIPEGKNMFEVGAILEENNILKKDDFVKACKAHRIAPTGCEGYLFPDTYYLAKNSRPDIIVGRMVNHFKTRTKNLNFTHPKLSKHELVTLASVVEKETGVASERPRIAGVFFNRLKKRMRLQSDPTTIYGIWHRFDGNLRKKDLLEKTPYNTYKISGLPKGPIANPGMAALKAVIQPETHQYLYFVSRNDGTHVFTPTYKDHLKEVQRYQLRR